MEICPREAFIELRIRGRSVRFGFWRENRDEVEGG